MAGESDNRVKLYSWHFMPYPYLPPNFDEQYESGWVTVPNSLFDRSRVRGLYQEYIDELAYADQLGYDGLVLNEHHQNIYGMMPSPNLIAAALTQRTTQAKLVVLGNLLPLSFRPIRIAEEYAMLDCMSGGRVIAGFAPGGGAEAFNYSYSIALGRERFWEGVDVIVQAWTQEGPTSYEGKHYTLRYINPWPQPLQRPHPPIWIPGSFSPETMYEVARREYSYFLSTRSKLSGATRYAKRYREVVEEVGKPYHPHKIGLLLSVYVAETDAIAKQESEEAVFYFTRNCLKGLHSRRGRRWMAAGHVSTATYEQSLLRSDPNARLLGDAESWQDIDDMGSIHVGSPETIRQRLWGFIREADIGNLLIQFHIGNLSYEKTQKSQRLFAEEVMPKLRADSAEYFAHAYPASAPAVAAAVA